VIAWPALLAAVVPAPNEGAWGALLFHASAIVAGLALGYMLARLSR
jgi:hypothetical protein